MVNNVISNGHYHKDWQSRVRTWLNQPARKLRRRENRLKKALRVSPAPIAGPLRPIVRCQTQRYNMRARIGRGFTLDELRAAGIVRKQAKTIGISVDHRRKNRSEESMKANVRRLKAYKARLVIFPRKAGVRKHGDASEAELKAAKQHKKPLNVLRPRGIKVTSRKITDEDRKFSAVLALQRAREDQRQAGKRQKKAKARADAKAK
eukprot:c1195_g1_i1.p1 GENE.c1195_g1_i1~~c1195_g1_i1.p1  ORF type:complete len:206 (-),score=34.97 c1195_g1_i1:56-673(-)